jgi:phytoene dehydrogenase-like protein
MIECDGIVIGAGHNSLTLAAYLTRAGMRVVVVEKNHHTGGGCTTAEPILPAHRCNLHSNFYMGFRHSPLVHDLELHRFGFSYIDPPVQQAAAFRDGTCVIIHKDIDRTCRSLARFSKRDAETFRYLHDLYGVRMRPLLTSLQYNAPLPPDELSDRISGPSGTEMLSHAQHDLFGVIRHYFEDARIISLFSSYMHVITAENAPGAGMLFPLVFSNVTGFALPVGGSAAFTNALQRVVEYGGGTVMTGTEVAEIITEGGRATGVRLTDGTRIGASRFVASGIDATTTMHLTGEDLFPQSVREKLNDWHWGSHSLVTLHLALRDAPSYRAAAFDEDIDRAFNIFFGMDTIEEVEQCFADCAANRLPRTLMGNGACNSKLDPTYAPAGAHTAFWWPFAPYELAEGPSWDSGSEFYTEQLLSVWREYADNLTPENVLGSHLFTPKDVERLNSNMVRGAVRMGAYIPSQLGINRPHPALSGTRTPVEGLYLCGSSTGNGGGINGAPGYIAAQAIVDDFVLSAPWERVPEPAWSA